MKAWASASAVALSLATGCYSGLDANSAPGASGADGGDGADGADGADGGDGGEDSGSSAPDEEVPQQVALSGARRLTTVEYRDTVYDLLGLDPVSAQTVLPEPELAPFDNDYTTQTESAALIVGVESMARRVAGDVVNDPELLQALLSCPADGAIDAACFETFLSDFGRRALRRPLSAEELSTWSAFFLAEAETAQRFSLAVEVALQTLLQHPEFLYRVDRGEVVDADAGVVRLDDWAIASRLSYLLWGVGPDDELLDAAAAGALRTGDEVGAAAQRMLNDTRAHKRIERFHAMWMGYEFMPIGGELGDAMRAETGALLRRVIFEENRPWQDVLRSEETFVSELLAEHYGLETPATAEGDWVDYSGNGRAGILSHGTFLSNGFKSGDTSPTLRGLAIRTRLLCQDVPPPPPSVNDSVPGSDETPETPCKIDRYAAHRTEPSCAACHALMDGLGFGLENYDQFGQFREHDVDHPECVIAAEGDVPGMGSFSGPAELGELLAGSEEMGACLVRQTYRFAVGRAQLDTVDFELIARVTEALGTGEFRFADLLIEHVSDASFGFSRRHEGDQ